MDVANLIQIRRDLHQIPELGFQEKETQNYLLTKLKQIANDRVEIKKWKTGILVKITGSHPTKTIGYRADMDGLPILEQSNESFRSKHKGKMHACGHDFHMTIALGVIQSIIRNPVKEHVVFIFQPAEEGPGGALPMSQSDAFMQWKPDCIFALHVAPELPVGTVSTKTGILFANTCELFIDFTGIGGHAAFPHVTKDMTVAASSFIVQMQQIISRNIHPDEGVVITIGKMESGVVQNAIAETARLEGTIRTLNPATIGIVKQQLENMKQGFEISYDCTISINYGSQYYQVYNNHKYVSQFKEIVTHTDISFIHAKAAMTGEDFGYMLKQIPGFMFWLGVDSPFGLHSSKFQPKEEALKIGVEVVYNTIDQLII